LAAGYSGWRPEVIAGSAPLPWACQGGALISPACFAFIAEHQGYSTGFVLFGVTALLTALLLAFTVTETVHGEAEVIATQDRKASPAKAKTA